MHRVAAYALAYLLWVVSVALGAVTLWVIRSTWQILFGVAISNPALSGNQKYTLIGQSDVVDRFGLVLLGLIAVILLIFVEHYYRSGVPNGELIRRFVRLSAIELAVLSLFHLVYFATAVSQSLLPLIGSYPLLIELAATGFFAWLWSRPARS